MSGAKSEKGATPVKGAAAKPRTPRGEVATVLREGAPGAAAFRAWAAILADVRANRPSDGEQ